MPPKKQSNEAAKERQRLYKKRRQAQVKNDPELLAIAREKRRAKYLKDKETKKVKSINEQSSRLQRKQRKSWRENSKTYRQKKKEEGEKHSDISFDAIHIEAITDNEGPEKCSKDPLCSSKVKNAIRKMRYKELKKRNALMKIIAEHKKKDKVRCNLIRKLKEMLKEAQAKIDGNNTLSSTLHQKSNDDTTSSEQLQDQEETTATVATTLFDCIQQFYLSDANSVLSAGKKEFITRNRVRMQKRYLRLPLKHLYQVFLSEHKQYAVSYSFFCKLRPFWVVFPREINRDTCQCSLHTNMELLIKALHRSRVISENNYQEVLTTLCCDPKNTDCLQKTCNACKSTDLKYNDVQLLITFYEWQRVKKVVTLNNGTKKDQTVIEKQKNVVDSVVAISKLKNDIVKFLAHTYKIVSQYSAIKELKENLNMHEALIHVDFSENYSLKYATEVQSFHFGGSRQQVSLHTAVIYTHSYSTGQVTPNSMCTISDCLRHDAPAIWAHLVPLIKEALTINDLIDTIHFLSDSPTSQYRNKYLFYIITQLSQDFPQLKQVTWNYSEAGHGKGAPDGVGATLKRTADRMVLYGQDVGTFDEFYDLITNCTVNDRLNIIVKKVEGKDVLLKNSLIPKNIKPFNGTFSVYQVLWEELHSTSVTMRTASCFSCGAPEICTHGKHLGYQVNQTRH